MQSYLHPAFIVYKIIIIIICFAEDTIVKVLENGKDVIKKIN